MHKLKDIIEKPQSGEWGDEDIVGDGVLVLRTTNFTNDGIIDFSNVVTRRINKSRAQGKYLQPGDIIIEKSGGSTDQPVGRVVFFDREPNRYLFNNFTAVIRLNKKYKNYPKYIFYYLFANYTKGETRKFQNKTTGISNLKLDRFIHDTELTLPRYETQRKIAKTLDTVSEMLALRKQQLADLDNLIKSTFYDMFGDPVTNEKGWLLRPIGQFSVVKIGPFGSLLHKEDYIEGGIPLVNPSHIVNSKIIPDLKMTISAGKINELRGYLMREGDIVVARRGEIGRCAVVGNKKFLCGTGSMFIRINQDYLPEVLQRVISSDTMRSRLEHQSVGVTMSNLNSGTISSLEVPMIPLSLQNQFSETLTCLQGQERRVEEAIDETQYLFDSLMSKYFD